MKECRNIPLFQPVWNKVTEEAALAVMRSGQIASGPLVGEFERKFGDLTGRDHVVSTNDMTSALVLALKLSDVKPGDQVATLAFSCLSTNAAIAMVGATPLWIDIDPASMSMNRNDLNSKISKNTKAVIAYHVSGYPSAMDEISRICSELGVPLIEDCDNALGGKYADVPLGKFGDFAIFSLYPNRQINGIEGGVLLCPSEEVAIRAKKLRRFGIDYSTFRDERGEINPASDVPEIGYSAPLNQLNAAVAMSQIDSLESRLSMAKKNAMYMGEELESVSGLRLVQPVSNGESAYWTLLMHFEKRDGVMARLKADGVSCSILHCRNDIYSGFGAENAFLPGTDYAMKNLLALPCGWWLGEEDVNYTVHAIKEAVRF